MDHRHKLDNWHFTAAVLSVYDIIAVHIAYFLALWVRFDCAYSRIPIRYLTAYQRMITVYAVLCCGVFWAFKLYRSMWKYASYRELARVTCISLCMSLIHSVSINLICQPMPKSYHIWGAMAQLILLLAARFSYRFLLLLVSARRQADSADRVMLIGAGAAGQMLLRDIHGAKEISDRVVCLIDDDPNKWHRYIDGVPVVGGRDSILAAAKQYAVNKIYLAIPSATVQEKRDILQICNETGCTLRQLPGMYQLVLGQVTVSDMKKVAVEDLLGREPIQADMREVYEFINGKVVLVTGGGGSIGSELCRQIAAHGPKQLIIFDVYENNAYSIQLELREKYPDLNLEVLIGSVRDSRRVFQLFSRYRPQIVYHAAAHKHVPLMEDSPCEAIKNNAIGTYKTAYAAMVHGCERFVLISTDKAVNPTNIMGASKRLCEMIIQSFDHKIKQGRASEIPQLFTHLGYENADKDGTGSVFKNIRTEFVAVRFGNVLGSNGSVIPIFRKQIEKGGPVTVTHPDIIRYFMTIPEAVSLVMLAGTYAHGGEIFVLDMGSPVKIADLARNLIRLSGYRPDVDIKIEYTGLRPGEKLYEEKLMAEEGLRKTDNDLIHIGCPIPFDTNVFLNRLEGLMQAAYANKANICDLVEQMVSTYRPERRVKPAVQAESVNAKPHEEDQ
ncbi:MAG: polysaccharide biosynthesis protein [Clostridia bacterium]|nr:polysaccharide biosynthesis protein [Clostridia bacterium]